MGTVACTIRGRNLTDVAEAMNPDPEDAVRRYLLFLVDPESLRDAEAVETATAAVATATDPIEKLRALAALESAQDVDATACREAFLLHAKTWADAEGISAKAFLELGVPAADLVAAGLTAAAGRARRAAAGGGARGRAPRLTLDEVAAKLPDGEFRLSHLAAAIDREPATTRNYLTKLVESGVVTDLGEDPRHDGRGKAPKLYIRT
jgi:hypothetical protein